MAFTMNRQKSEDLLRAADPEVHGADLVALAVNRNVLVKAAVAAREDCPMAAMFSLAQEDDPRILEALLGNANVPRGLLVHLAQNRRAHVRELAHTRLARVSED